MKDPCCGTYVPVNSAYKAVVRGEAVYFCSGECGEIQKGKLLRSVYEVFIDTGNIEETKEGLKLGMVDGVTTGTPLLWRRKRRISIRSPGRSWK